MEHLVNEVLKVVKEHLVSLVKKDHLDYLDHQGNEVSLECTERQEPQ